MMRNWILKILCLSLFVLGSLAFLTLPAEAYVINGQVDDWGVTLSDALGALDSSGNKPNVDLVVTEDNAYSGSPWTQVGPGYTVGNWYDVEALYADINAGTLYLAIITGFPKGGHGGFETGDVAITANGKEFGIATHDHDGFLAGTLYDVSDWYDVMYPTHAEANPWKIKSGTNPQSVDFAYAGPDTFHYVIEAAIPLIDLGITDGNHNILLSFTMECGNDYLRGQVPEPATMLLMGIGLLGMATVGRKKLVKRR